MSIFDEIADVARANQAVFAAGVRAADETSPAARKLRRLIERVGRAEGWLSGLTDRQAVCEELRAAIKEARTP